MCCSHYLDMFDFSVKAKKQNKTKTLAKMQNQWEERESGLETKAGPRHRTLDSVVKKHVCGLSIFDLLPFDPGLSRLRVGDDARQLHT